MQKEKGLKEQKKQSKKKRLKAKTQEVVVILNEEEMRKKGGIIGDKKHIIIGYLRSYHNKKIFYDNMKNLTGLVNYIYEFGRLYVKSHGGFRPMKYSSINDYVHQLSTIVLNEIEEEKKYKKKYKSRY